MSQSAAYVLRGDEESSQLACSTFCVGERVAYLLAAGGTSERSVPVEHARDEKSTYTCACCSPVSATQEWAGGSKTTDEMSVRSSWAVEIQLGKERTTWSRVTLHEGSTILILVGS